MEFNLMTGAEPYEINGKNVGILFLHGYASSPQVLKKIASAFAEDHYTVKVPLLSGHGTSPEHLHSTTVEDLIDSATEALNELKETTAYQIIFGFSLGGGLAIHLAQHHHVDGLILLNSFFQMPSKMLQEATLAIANGDEYIPTGTVDIKNPKAHEIIYDKYPAQLTMNLVDFSNELIEKAEKVVAPVLIMQSTDDHVIRASSADFLLNRLGSRERHLVMLHDSYHVAPLDYDQGRIIEQSMFFVKGLDPERYY